MKKMIEHNEAIELENIIRKVYSCDRYGVMGIANADYLERHPLEAAIIVFAPLYKSKTPIAEVEEFVEKYYCLFENPEDYTYDEEQVRDYINCLKELVQKYC